jgi:hypothetical protein
MRRGAAGGRHAAAPIVAAAPLRTGAASNGDDMRKYWIAALGSGFIAACGGGGGDGNPATPDSITITAANQRAVASAAAGAAATIAGAGGGIGASTGASAAGAARSFAAQLARHTTARRKLIAAMGRPGPLAIPPETVPCSVSGNVTLSVTDANGDETPSAGDTLSMAFNDCRETATDRIDGSMAVTLTEIEVDGAGRLSFTGATVIDDLAVTDGERLATLDGAVTLSYADLSSTQSQLRLVVRDAGLSASATVGGETETVRYEPDFSYQETLSIDAGGASTSAVIQGGFGATSIGGRVELQTALAIRQRAADDYPYQGVLRVLGEASALRLSAVDAATVRVELDAANDGTYESSETVAWSVLLGD